MADTIDIDAIAEAALPMFRLNDWRYGTPGRDSVPTAARLAETIASLIAYVENGSPYARSGRFYVTRDFYGRIVVTLELS